MKKVAFYTLGCKVNQYETNAMSQRFIENGYKVVENSQIADIYIINTCTVTNMSDRKSRQMIRKFKEKNNDAIIVAVGCYAQVNKEELEKIEQLDIILGTDEKKDIINYIEKFIKNKNANEQISNVMKRDEFIEFGTTLYNEKTRAVIKIQDGCDRFCSYCIIPYARGKVKSRSPKNVVEEIKQISKQGIKEIVITGIHVASYGKDFKEKYELIDLLEEINKIEQIQRIRLSSIEPTIIQENFIKRIIKLDKICNHFHLSLQSGCNEVLKRMNRKYTIQEFEDSVKLLRKYYKEVSLTTDIIVGFPGETQEEFNDTYNFLKRIKFYKMHIFKYSPRKNTLAAKMPNQISDDIKDIRSHELIKLSEESETEYNKNYIGKIVEVLIEEKSGKYYKGHTKNYLVVNIESEDINLENTIKLVEIKSEQNLELFGVLH